MKIPDITRNSDSLLHISISYFFKSRSLPMKVSGISSSSTFLTLLQSQTKDWPTFMCESYFRQFSGSPVDLSILLEKMEEHSDCTNLWSSVKRDSTVGNSHQICDKICFLDRFGFLEIKYCTNMNIYNAKPCICNIWL